MPAHPLDNPIWRSLTTRHAHLAQGGPLARRYPAEISPLSGLPAAGAANVAALTALVAVGDEVGVFEPAPLALPPPWVVLREARITQMVRDDRSPLPEGDIEPMPLGAADVDRHAGAGRARATRTVPRAHDRARALHRSAPGRSADRHGRRADVGRQLSRGERRLCPSRRARTWSRAGIDRASRQPDAQLPARRPSFMC